jgi:hypothetical protein
MFSLIGWTINCPNADPADKSTTTAIAVIQTRPELLKTRVLTDRHDLSLPQLFLSPAKQQSIPLFWLRIRHLPMKDSKWHIKTPTVSKFLNFAP